MSSPLLTELRALAQTWRGNSLQPTLLGAPDRGLAVPRNSELELAFPAGVNDAHLKILYALHREGRQCYCNLRLLTGLYDETFDEALASLLKQRRIVKDKLPAVFLGENEAMHSFELVK